MLNPLSRPGIAMTLALMIAATIFLCYITVFDGGSTFFRVFVGVCALWFGLMTYLLAVPLCGIRYVLTGKDWPKNFD